MHFALLTVHRFSDSVSVTIGMILAWLSDRSRRAARDSDRQPPGLRRVRLIIRMPTTLSAIPISRLREDAS